MLSSGAKILSKSFFEPQLCLKSSAFFMNIPLKSIVIMGWQCYFLIVVSALVASHASKVVLWYEDGCRRRAKKNIFWFKR